MMMYLSWECFDCSLLSWWCQERYPVCNPAVSKKFRQCVGACMGVCVGALWSVKTNKSVVDTQHWVGSRRWMKQISRGRQKMPTCCWVVLMVRQRWLQTWRLALWLLNDSINHVKPTRAFVWWLICQRLALLNSISATLHPSLFNLGNFLNSSRITKRRY